MSWSPLEIEDIGDATVVRFTEKRILDEQFIQEIGEDLFSLVDTKGRKKLWLDFGKVEYLSSALLGWLINLEKKVSTVGGHLGLCNLDPQIVEVFRITKLDRIIKVRRREDDSDPEGELGGVRSRLIPPKPSHGQSVSLQSPSPDAE